jgi:hypothetical protein
MSFFVGNHVHAFQYDFLFTLNAKFQLIQDFNVASSPPSETKKRRLPGWVLFLIVVAIPTAFITLGRIMGAHYAEIFVFMILCLFGACLTYFLR